MSQEKKHHPAPVIILGVTGSIAAHKSADIASTLVKAGATVHAVLTRHATDFVTPLTLQTLTRNPVTTSLADERQSWHPSHITLADSAHLLLIAPATANTIAKLAHGLADDPLTSIALATTAPLLIAPAMNGHMWSHPATTANTATLRSRGAHFIGPAQGLLACGYQGIGRLWDPADIASRALQLASTPQKNPPHNQ